MAQHVVRRFALQNAGPRMIASSRLFTQPGEPCRQVMVCGLEPASVEGVQITWRNRPIVDVRGSMDWETGRWVTGGEHLARLNAYAGLTLCGGHFSVLFDDFGSAINLPHEDCVMLNLTLNEKVPTDGRYDIALLCGTDL